MGIATPKRILLPTDLSENAAVAIPYATAMAHDPQARIVVVHVVHASTKPDNDEAATSPTPPTASPVASEAREELEALHLNAFDPDKTHCYNTDGGESVTKCFLPLVASVCRFNTLYDIVQY